MYQSVMITHQKIREIRSFNKKLMEITKEHKQVALIEIDIESIIHDMAYILIS